MKRKVCISVDEDLWTLADHKLNCSRSEFINEQLKIALGINDEEQKCIDKIQELKTELNMWEGKLCNIRKLKNLEQKENKKYVYVLGIVERIASNQGFIGNNQIMNIANQHKLDFDKLSEFIVDEGFVVKPFGEQGAV